jgi:beta-phosphoglucomutase-like phosphatase (HAD superfamily)
MKNSFAAIVFDMDGTLVDTEVVWHEAESQLVAARGEVYTLEARATLLGLRLDEGLTGLKAFYGFPDDVPALVDELNRNMLKLIEDGVKLNDGIPDIVDLVVQRNIPRAIASASPVALIEAIVQSLGWGDIFTIRCSADDEKAGKPAPDVYLRAAERLGVNPTDCLALEDTLAGAKAATAAGMTCYVVPDLRYTPSEAFAGVTSHVFGSFVEVYEALR